MLRSMREGAKSPIMKAFLLFLAGGFALWGIGDITSGTFGAGSKAVSAGDKSISTTDAAYEFDRARRNLAAGLSIGEALETPLLNEVMGSLARKVLFSAEADRLGLTVTRDMQTKAIRDERAFQDEFGSFAEGRFLQTLAQLGFSEDDYLARLTETLERDQIMGAVSAAARYPSNAAAVLADYQLEDRVVLFKGFDVDADAIAAPSDDVLASWYEENSEAYDAPILRQFNAIILDPSEIEQTITIDEAALKDSFDLRRDEFITPETRALLQMVFDTQADADAAAKAVKAGADFSEEAATRLNWTQDDINLGTLREDALDSDLAAAAFAADAGAIVGPIETAFGFHVMKVEAINEGGASSFEDVKPQLEARLKAEQALDLVFERANELEDILGGGASLQEAASAINSAVSAIDAIDANGFNIDGADARQDIAADSNFLSIGWELDEGEISVLAETGEATFFVVELVEETEATPRPLSDVKSRVSDDYRLEQAIIAAKATADTALEASSAFDGIDTVTIKRSGIGLDHPAASLIARQAFALNQGETAVIETGDEAIIIKTTAIEKADIGERDALADQLSASLARTVQSDWTAALSLSLSEDFDLTINEEAVRILLVGATQ